MLRAIMNGEFHSINWIWMSFRIRQHSIPPEVFVNLCMEIAVSPILYENYNQKLGLQPHLPIYLEMVPFSTLE